MMMMMMISFGPARPSSKIVVIAAATADAAAAAAAPAVESSELQLLDHDGGIVPAKSWLDRPSSAHLLQRLGRGSEKRRGGRGCRRKGREGGGGGDDTAGSVSVPKTKWFLVLTKGRFDLDQRA